MEGEEDEEEAFSFLLLSSCYCGRSVGRAVGRSIDRLVCSRSGVDNSRGSVFISLLGCLLLLLLCWSVAITGSVSSTDRLA